uniref:Cep57 centrosome localisation domain-containing protein n=1 Tax=Aureoumbra lagunensis TaxID=44058 RepID=A0A7S3NNL8_9STRA|mmetsp:Transcript_7018/g.10466  ORF Transcript_7018/g.10466 Transcript_7018/m.10466 type:complete len:285 (+) Transcript_7018:142-996(+)
MSGTNSEWNGSPLMGEDEISAKTTSSRAVLAALRALQDKIRRLEEERLAAIEEANECKRQLSSQQTESSLSSKNLDYERLMAENRALQRRLAAAERTTRNYEEESLFSRKSHDDATTRRLADVEAALENMIAANRLLAASVGSQVPEEDDLVADAASVLTASRVALERARHYTKRRTKPKIRSTRPDSSAVRSKTEPISARPRSSKRTVKQNKKRDTVLDAPGKPVPWLPSSNNDATSYNLLAACNYALKRGSSQPTTSSASAIPYLSHSKKKSSRRHDVSPRS